MENLDWQNFLDRLTKICKLDGVFPIFSQLSTDVERFKFCSNHKLISTKLSAWFQRNPTKVSIKDRLKSMNCKAEGNRAYVKKNDDRALQYYNDGILYSPSEDLSVLYSNRSAVLFSKELYKKCIVDIELALEYNFPKEKQWKLYKRKGEAELKLKSYEDAKLSFQKALELVDPTDTYGKKRREEIENLLKTITDSVVSSLSTESVIASDQPDARADFKPYDGYDDILSCGSRALKIGVDEKRGRHLTARSEIPAGSILISEKPYAAVLLPSWYHSHCQNCFSKITSLFPCKQCTDVCYCSVKCADESWKHYHHIECGKLNLMEKIGIAHLALRVVVVTELKEILRLVGQSDNDVIRNDVVNGCGDDGVYRSNYESVYNLLPHSNVMQTEDLFQYTVAGVLLHLILQKSGGEQFEFMLQSNVSSIESLHVGSVLVRHIQQLVCNAHAVTALTPCDSIQTDTNIIEQDQVRIATAIYPTTSLSNHSCEPTILNSFHRDRLIVKAVQNVKKGEEIFNCYGPHFRRMEFSERQELLKQQYFFTCECPHCLKGVSIEKKLNCFVCKQCRSSLQETKVTQCAGCGQAVDYHLAYDLPLQESRDHFTAGLDALKSKQNKESVKKAIMLFTKCLKIQNEILYEKHSMLAKTYDVLAKCYVILHEYKQAIDFLAISIEIVETHYGENSIELTNEILKLSDIYMELMQQCIDKKSYENIRSFLPDALKITENGIKLVELNKEPGNEDLLDLKKKHAALTKLRFMPVL